MMIAFWPEVPFYLKAELCLEKECVQSSQQILLWSNTTNNPCHDTYNWACGNFEKEYLENDYYVLKKGEWNYKTYNEFQGKMITHFNQVKLNNNILTFSLLRVG